MEKLSKYKNVIIGFIAVCLVSGFSWLCVSMFKDTSEKQLQESKSLKNILEQRNKESALNEQIANKKRDSALAILNVQKQNDFIFNQKLDKLSINVNGLQYKLNKSLQELNSIKNEKDYVTDAPISEQYDFVSKYKYEEFK